MAPNEPTDLRNIALNSEFGEKAIWRNDLLPLRQAKPQTSLPHFTILKNIFKYFK